jgi:hypothetical protein
MDKDATVLIDSFLTEAAEFAKRVEGMGTMDAAMLLALCKLTTAIDQAARRIANTIIEVN